MVKLEEQKLNNYPKELQDYFHKMSITSDFDIIGSAHYKNFAYTNDYDLNENFKTENNPKVLNNLYKLFLNKFTEAEKDPNQLITDFKCGELNGESVRWNYDNMKKGYQIIKNKKITFQECLLMDSTIKLDEVVFINGLATEITNNYFIKIGNLGNYKQNTKDDIIKMLEESYDECLSSKKYFKALKRKFSIYQIKHPNQIHKKLLLLLNSNDGRLYKVISDLKLIILLLELKGKKPTKMQIINNLQQIKFFASKITKFKLDFLSTEIDKICDLKNKNKMIHQLEILADKLNSMLNKDVKDKI
jgi:hypothetical protein